MDIIAALVIGAIAGWLVVASWVPQLGVVLGSGTLGAILDATIGSVIILVILSPVRRV